MLEKWASSDFKVILDWDDGDIERQEVRYCSGGVNFNVAGMVVELLDISGAGGNNK